MSIAWECGWCGERNEHAGVICEKCSRGGQPPPVAVSDYKELAGRLAAAEARLAETERQRDEALDELADFGVERPGRLACAEASAARAEEALRQYGRHTAECACEGLLERHPMPAGCQCGLRAALSGGAEGTAE